MTDGLRDPFAASAAPLESDPAFVAPRASLTDPFAFNGGRYDRPPRTEDKIERHAGPNDGRPKLWVPEEVGDFKAYYGRPSSAGKKVEDPTNLHKWETRVMVDGFLNHGEASRALRLEWAATDPGDKDLRWEICEKAKALSEFRARVGTAVHAITERYDLGLEVNPPDEFVADLEEWIRLSRHFEIVDLPDGRPAVECFVAMDIKRDRKDWPRGTREATKWIRYAGTFDRIWRYTPCSICGRRNRIVDLKTGKVEFGAASIAVQEGIYSGSRLYVPRGDRDDSAGADRFDLPDVCPHRAIVVHLPAGSGQGQLHWVDIARGRNTAITLIPQVMDHRRERNWMIPFESRVNLELLIERAESAEEVHALWANYPVREWWTENDNALSKQASAKIASFAVEVAQNRGDVLA